MKVKDISITTDLSLFEARDAVRKIADRIGFSRRVSEELAIVVSELCSNILKHAIRGTLRIEPVDDPERGPGVGLVASDDGPPIRDILVAVRDGHDDRGPVDPATIFKRRGLGTGLGAVIRLTDTFELQPGPPGKKICVVRYLKKDWKKSRRRSSRAPPNRG